MHFSKKQPETRVLRAINGEGDLVPFQQIDPHMLMSKLHG